MSSLRTAQNDSLSKVAHFQNCGSLSSENHFSGPGGGSQRTPDPELLYYILRMANAATPAGSASSRPASVTSASCPSSSLWCLRFRRSSAGGSPNHLFNRKRLPMFIPAVEFTSHKQEFLKTSSIIEAAHHVYYTSHTRRYNNK